MLAQVIPKAAAVIDYEVEHEFPQLGRRTMLVTARTLCHPDNASHAMLLLIVDVTERRRDEAAQQSLAGELRHRVRNLFSLAGAIARQTPTHGRSAEEYRDAFLGRFEALVEAHDLAFTAQKKTALADVITCLLTPHMGCAETVVIEPGAPVDLEPRAITALSLVLHEMATNAAKYGGLSVAGGGLRVGWRIDDASRAIRLHWIESGGPAVTPPTDTGYGTQLIRATATYTLGGTVDFDYAPTGLTAELVIPLRAAEPAHSN